MQLNHDVSSFTLLYEAVISYYKKNGDRHISIFADKSPEGGGGKFYIRFLLDRKHVVEYVILQDRGFSLSGLSLAIGPHYFGPADFWSYKDSERFTLEASTEGVQKNLELLDEFLAYTNI